MKSKYTELLKVKLGETFSKLEALENEKLNNYLGEYIELCNPESVFMCDDSDEDANFVRNRSLELGEEKKLSKSNRTVHYDGYGDQARDKKNTKFMVPKQKREKMGKLNCVDFDEGLKEIKTIAKDVMHGRKAIVKIFCEGPTESIFSRPCVQLTDSCYVAHSEDILYRRGYEHFKKMKNKDDFYRFCHSAGELDENMNTVNLDKRRIYMDIENNIVYSMNAQYAGNTVGLKKHSMRLAINESGKNGWLCEHMFLMTIVNEKKKREMHFCGAFPSACGKTSTAMIPGEKILGDDICYFRNVNGEFKAVNVENGIFGIIKDVNVKDDPVIFNALHEDKEMIFSNVLVGPDNNPYWLGMDVDTPDTGKNHSGEGWTAGKKDSNGKEIPLAHPNSRYTMKLEYLDNIDEEFRNKDGVTVDAIVYGGRDSDTTVPVEESRSWKEGIVLKAVTLESETTSATLGAEGVRVPCMMANLDFISYPIGEYINNNVKFVDEIKTPPKVFSVNYFLKQNGNFCTSKLAKKVWLHWAEGRCAGDYSAYETPTGFIPKYDDLKELFKDLLGEEYSKDDYDYQFSFRCQAWVNKLNRSIKNFKENYPDTPEYVYSMWNESIEKIGEASKKYGDVINPGDYKG
jgi:phosphoenolpyruvate carboxykinase (GTP)